jgi:hypothetical protein
MTEELPQEELENEPTEKIAGESAFEEKPEEKAEEKPQEDEEKRKSRIAYQIGELKRKAREAKEEAERERQARRQLEEQTKIKEEPKEDNYPDYEAYNKDRQKWETQKEQEIREKVARELKEEEFKKKKQTAEARRAQNYAEQRNEMAQNDKKFAEHEGMVSDFVNLTGSIELRNFIMESKKGAQIISYLGKHPKHLDNLEGLDDVAQINRIVDDVLPKLDAKQVKKVSSAPDPVRSGKKSAIAPVNPENETYAEYIRRKNFGT